MLFEINDSTLISEITSFQTLINTKFGELNMQNGIEQPLDDNVIDFLNNRIKPNDKNITYDKGQQLDDLWALLIEKSIKCLRYFDDREPFMKNDKKMPVAFGIDNLKNYHKKYIDFERLLYGGANHYRDHVFHAIRTWLIGIFCLLKEQLSDDNVPLISKLDLDGETNNNLFGRTNFFEKISIWTLIALCHDLGYPLEKSQLILEKTNNMMKEFISNPTLWNNYTFSGGQSNINEYIVKFISTKIKRLEEDKYYGRIQPKYYIKFTKSLESFKHGIVSAAIIYTTLLYFLEADFNLNDDYIFDSECARQFYIRREILRAIASHTCSDIYSIKMSTFTSLLFVCDELQEWGRKTWDQLYIGDISNSIDLNIEAFNPKQVKVFEKIDMTESLDQVIPDYILRVYNSQYSKYKLVFRDGQYSNNREFDFSKYMTIELKNQGASKRQINIEFHILSTERDEFKIELINVDLRGQIEVKIQECRANIQYFDEIKFAN